MALRKVAFAVSGALVLMGLIAFVEIVLGHANMGVDFSGGTLLQYKTERSFSLEEVRATLKANDIPGVDLQEVTNENRLIVKIKKSEEKVGDLGDRITALLAAMQGDQGFLLESKSEIGASVSADLRSKAIISILLSMLGVIIYLAFRFDFRFGVAATVATIHDVLAVLGLCWLMDKEINLLIVTALLTLAGYSLNDTVVIFDRIRENMHTDEKITFFEIINNSINQVLGRSIMTGMSVLFTLAALFFFGGATLHDFSFALLVGLVVALFSSVFVASPLLTIKWSKSRAT